MKRLTEKFVCNLPDDVLARLGIADVPKEDYEIKEVFGATCKEVCEEHKCSNCPINKVINKLAKYEDTEEQGLLLKLPCNIGDKLYTVEEWLDTGELSVLEYTFNGIERAGYRLMYEDNEEDITVFGFDEIGKTVFLSKSEAEQALERRKHE